LDSNRTASPFKTTLGPLRRIVAATFSAALAFSALSALPAHATVTTGSMNVGRILFQANSLPDGRVLFTGGRDWATSMQISSSEIYDPATGVFTNAAPMQLGRTEHAAVTLKDGRVLVVGGVIATSPSLVGTKSAEIFDPATGLWTAAGEMIDARARTMARLLPDGRVIVMSSDGMGSGIFNAEVYDPQTGLFTKTGYLQEASGWHGLVVMADGRVMKVGGYKYNYSNRVEIWNPATNQWTATGSLATPRQDSAPALLPDGKVLVAGGGNGMSLNSTEIYDPATGLFSAGSTMPISFDSTSPVVVPLPNGNIVFSVYDKKMLHYQSATGQWNLTGPKRTAVRGDSVTLLPGGDLLLAGGSALNDATRYAAVWDHACAPQQISLATASQNIGSAGGRVNFTVNAAPGCRFELTDVPAWAVPDSNGPWAMPAGGRMTLGFAVPANGTGVDRNATFSLGNVAATIVQPASPLCPTIPVLSADVFNFTSAASSGTILVTAPATCPWNFSSLPSFVTAASATSGSGNGSFSFNVIQNAVTVNGPNGPRSGSGQMTGPGFSKTFTVNQQVSPCLTWSVSPGSLNFPIAGSTGSFTINAAASCNWSLSSIPTWMTVSSATTGSGTATINYSVAANSGAARSTTAYFIGGGPLLSLGLNQAGTTVTPVCSTAINSGTPVSGNLQSGSTCPVGTRGAGYYTDRYSFTSAPGRLVTIALTSSAFDTYLYLRDPAGTVIKSDDDGGGGTNSRIPAGSGSFTLPAGSSGVYTIEVTSYSSGRTGAYALSLTQ
jgi:hypothetical protein